MFYLLYLNSKVILILTLTVVIRFTTLLIIVYKILRVLSPKVILLISSSDTSKIVSVAQAQIAYKGFLVVFHVRRCRLPIFL